MITFTGISVNRSCVKCLRMHKKSATLTNNAEGFVNIADCILFKAKETS